MHMLIRGLVYAENSGNAVQTAKHDVFFPLVEDGPFTSYLTFDEDRLGITGSDRWGDYPAAAEADSDLGQHLIEQGWQSTVDEYQRSFDRIQEFLDNHNREEFWRDEDVHSQYQSDFHHVSQNRGPATYLYDQDGNGIRHQTHLEKIRNLSREENLDAVELYVVPADARY